MTRSYIADGISKRNKTFFKLNKHMKKYIYDESTYFGTEEDRITKLTYYIEFDRDQTTSLSSDFNTNHDSKLVDLKIDNDFISASGTENITTSITDGDQHTKIFLEISESLKPEDTNYKISQLYLEELKKQIRLNNFTFSFTDENGNTVIANTVLSLQNDGFHKDFYRYNVLYKFGNNPNIEFKLVNAHVSATSNLVRNGDKVWVVNRDGEYLGGNFSKGQFVSGKIFFRPEENYRILFEIHAFNDINMDSNSRIPSNLNIPTDYGFKLEILPSTIKDLFDGLSSFVDGYTFEDDGDYIVNDNNPTLLRFFDRRGASWFYNIETGESQIGDFVQSTNLPYIDDVTYDIDEVFLTYENDEYSFNFNNDYSNSKVFFNATEI